MNNEARTQAPDAGSVRIIPLRRGHSRGISVRALNTSQTTGERTVLVEVRTGDDVIGMALSASEAAELMFELGFALEESARIANGQPPRRPA